MSENRQAEKAGNSMKLYSRDDVRNISALNLKQKLEIAKSNVYIGYKMLWIMKLMLEGKKIS
jgi:hypothetical protein